MPAGRDGQCRGNTGTAGMADRSLADYKNIRVRADHGKHMDSKNAA